MGNSRQRALREIKEKMMNDKIIKSIREAEKKSHLEIYSTAKLFESGSWLQKPVKTVVDFKKWMMYNTLRWWKCQKIVAAIALPAAAIVQVEKKKVLLRYFGIQYLKCTTH